LYYCQLPKLYDQFYLLKHQCDKKVVLIDDIVDSGESMVEILKILKAQYPHCEFKIATIFYKQTALIQPDFTVKEAKNWIEFFWEVDLL